VSVETRAVLAVSWETKNTVATSQTRARERESERVRAGGIYKLQGVDVDIMVHP
jgi:hypothetical protein